MHIKKLFIGLFSFILFILCSNKISAANVDYCTYNDELSLIMPVTLGVDIEAIDRHYPFSENKKLYLSSSIFVYNEETCNEGLSSPYIDSSKYIIIPTYYYIYNNEVHYVNDLGKGVYSSKDMTSPSISAFFDTITANVNEYIELDVLTSYINAHDETDGNLIPEITYDNYSSNFNKLGEYSIIFKACDKSNNCSEYLLKIKVIDNTSPSIVGNSNVKSYMSNPLSMDEAKSSLKAIDNYDGDITTKLYVVDNNYNINLPGIYYIYYQVKDNSNNYLKEPFKLSIEVIDDISPVIEGPTIFDSKLSNILSTKTILSNMIISDNVDKQAYKNIYIIDDEYTANQKKIGTYKLVIGAYDNYGNESLPYIITINVIDDVAPTIDGETIYDSYLSSPISLLEIKSSLIVFDNYDGNLFNKLEILEDNYSLNKEKIGVYYINFIVKDSSNNISLPHQVEIIIHDDVAPIIEGLTFYRTLNTKKLDPLSIQLSLKAYDNIDGDLSNDIILDNDTYSNNFNNIGSYFLSFIVSDKSGNLSNLFKVKIQVDEDLTFLETVNQSNVYLSTSTLKNIDDILAILEIDSSNFSKIDILENTYTENYNIVGEYFMKLEIENIDFSKEYLTINIKTYQEETIDKSEKNNIPTNYKQEKKETIFDKLVSFFKNLFSKIIDFFKNLFR